METLHQLKHGFEEYNKDIGVKYQEFNENLARKFVFLGEEIELIKNNFKYNIKKL